MNNITLTEPATKKVIKLVPKKKQPPVLKLDNPSTLLAKPPTKVPALPKIRLIKKKAPENLQQSDTKTADTLKKKA